MVSIDRAHPAARIGERAIKTEINVKIHSQCGRPHERVIDANKSVRIHAGGEQGADHDIDGEHCVPVEKKQKKSPQFTEMGNV